MEILWPVFCMLVSGFVAYGIYRLFPLDVDDDKKDK